MLFKANVVDGIRSGTITVAFRSWKRPTVRAGGTLQSPAGLLAIDEVTPVDAAAISVDDARAAGFESPTEVLASVRSEPGRDLYRVRFHRQSDDPRLALRERSVITDDERAEIDAQLHRWDRASSDGPWTRPLLDLLAQFPAERSADLADRVGSDQLRLKRRVRQLKGLGLTESLGTGYRLSPRGEAYRTPA